MGAVWAPQAFDSPREGIGSALQKWVGMLGSAGTAKED